MRGKKRAGDDAGKKKVVPGRAGKAAPRGKGTRPANSGKLAPGKGKATVIKAGAPWPFPKAAWPDLADKDRTAHFEQNIEDGNKMRKDLVDQGTVKLLTEIMNNGLPKRLRKAV